MAENLPNAEHRGWSATRSFGRIEGLHQVPVMSDTNVAAEIVRLHAPCETITWTWTATRVGSPPIAPSPFDVDSNNVLLATQIGSAVPTPDPAGGHIWTLTGIYTYAQVTPVGVTAPIPTGKMPWEAGIPHDSEIPSTNFQSGLLGQVTLNDPLPAPIQVP